MEHDVVEPTVPSSAFEGDTFAFSKSGTPQTRSPRRRLLPVLGVVVSLAVVATAFVVLRPSGAGATLALAFRESDTQRYHVTMSMDASVDAGPVQQPMVMQASETIVIRVESVDEEGNATLVLTVEDLTGTMNGQAVPVPAVPEMRMVVAPDGRIVETTFGGVSLDASTTQPANGQLWPFLPDEPVSPGDTWDVDHEQELPGGWGTISVDSANEFLRYEDLAGVRVAVIHSRMPATIDVELDAEDLSTLMPGSAAAAVPPDATFSQQGELDLDQTAWLDQQAGEVVRSEGYMDFDFQMSISGGGVPIPDTHMTGHMTFSLERL